MSGRIKGTKHLGEVQDNRMCSKNKDFGESEDDDTGDWRMKKTGVPKNI